VAGHNSYGRGIPRRPAKNLAHNSTLLNVQHAAYSLHICIVIMTSSVAELRAPGLPATIAFCTAILGLPVACLVQLQLLHTRLKKTI
jgi:hypothetical protein